MASVNKVIIVGNLGQDPDCREYPSGGRTATLSIATSDRWRDKNTGENKESTEWHRVVLSGRLAEVAQEFLRKGAQVYIEGRLRTRSWNDNATGQERYITEVQADTMQMLGKRPAPQHNSHGGYEDY